MYLRQKLVPLPPPFIGLISPGLKTIKSLERIRLIKKREPDSEVLTSNTRAWGNSPKHLGFAGGVVWVRAVFRGGETPPPPPPPLITEEHQLQYLHKLQ